MNIEIKNDIDVGGNYSYGGKYTFPSFALSKILQFSMPVITVKKIPKDINIEDTYVFQALVNQFNKAYGTNMSCEEILYSRSSFSGFKRFITRCIVKGFLVINKECQDEFLINMETLGEKYAQNLRSIEKYYDEIIRTVYCKEWSSQINQEIKDEMYLFEQAYSLMKVEFKNEKRESGERYFEHLKGVMEITMRELPNPNLSKILIALLHDVQEDIPEYADVVRKIYGNYIADGVNILSKKDWKLYLSESEKELCWPFLETQQKLFDEVTKTIIEKYPDKSFTAPSKIKKSDLIKAMNKEQLEYYTKIQENIKPFETIAKERRNKDYFGHLEDLNDDYLDVKFADRIHNLRDMSWLTKEKTLRKIAETEKYFLEVAKKRNPTAYNLMMTEIERLKWLFSISLI